MKKLFLIVLSPCFLLFTAEVYSASSGPEYQFDHIDNMRGLSNNEVASILRDSRGFMWFGTASGLNRYDGNAFRVYRSGEMGIPHNNISWMGEDSDGNLWILGYSEARFTMYDWRTDSFNVDTDSLLRSRGLPVGPALLRFDTAGNMYAIYGRNGGIYGRMPGGTVVHYPQGDSIGMLSRGRIVSLAFGEGKMWVMNARGVLECLDTGNGSVVMRDTFFSDNSRNSTINKSVFLDSDGDVWVYPAMGDEGAALFDPRSGKWRFFDTNTGPALSNGLVRAVGQDQRGLIWIGTDHGGINLFDKDRGTITVLRHDPSNPRSIGQNTVISLWCDPLDGIVWAGTYKNGVSVYHPDMFKFMPGGAFEAMSTVDCNAFCKDSNGNLWIGTNGDGLICYNEQTGLRRVFTNNPKDNRSLSSNIVTAIIEDSAGVIWIGTYFGGLCSWDGDRFTRYEIDESDPNTISSRSVYGISEDDDGNLWIGTLGGGVDKLDPARRIFTHHNTGNTPGLRSDYVISVSDIFDGNIYLCTSQGIAVIDTASGEIVPGPDNNGPRLPSPYGVPNYVICDSNGSMWVAADNDIRIYDRQGSPIRILTVDDGLPASEFVSLVEDRAGDIWAGSRAGLVRISREGGEVFRITCYYAEDGLPGQVFNLNAAYRDNRGRLYFGTTKGYAGFDPLKTVSGSGGSALRFTDLFVNGHRVEPDPDGGRLAILRSSIDDTREITLRPGQTEVEFRFSAMDFVNPERVRYSYRLEGFDREWRTVGREGAAAYSNLNPGTYTFRVRASMDDGAETGEPIKMNIDVKAPLWLSWWAVILYVMTGVLLVRLLVEHLLEKQRKHYIEAQRMLEINQKHEVDEMKFRFFTNVSHEFKTPVTLILTPLEQLLRNEESPEKRSLMEIMHRNARALLAMVNEILDLRKLEMDKLVLRPASGEIIGFIKDICQSFSTFSEERSIRLTFTTWLEELHMDFDADKMTKILTNLLANAFQYTAEGSVDVSVSISEAVGTGAERNLCISVSDTGVGIASDHIYKIFERFYRVEEGSASAGSGTGLGLHMASEFSRMHGGGISVESSPGQGSVFTVTIPIRNSTSPVRHGSKLITPHASGVSVSPPGTGEGGGGNGKPLLLAVDDNDDFREFVSGLLEGSYKVITASDGREAWGKVLEDLPDLILADVMMPGMDGLEFCRMVKGDIRTSHIPVVLLTARSSEESKYSGIEAGADDYISKPFDIDMLMLRISKIIERQKVLYDRFRGRIDISPSEIAVTTMDEKFVRRAVAIVEENIDKPDFLVEDLCRELGISRVYFYKKILTLTDKTPSEFIRFIRLKRAADLLEKSQLFVGEVAYKVGFNDPKYFRGYFKKEFGITPSEYKKRFEES